MQRAKSVDEYFASNSNWQAELSKLRKAVLSTELEETLKWGGPCYTIGGKNVAGIGAFKNYVGLWFYQGVFLKDPRKVLINAQEGTTKALRQWRFESTKQMVLKDIKAYLLEAIQNQKAGKAIAPTRKQALALPIELKRALASRARAKSAFAKLTPGRQREYAEHIGSAKREATRLSRLEQALPLIEAGKGLHDHYRNC